MKFTLYACVMPTYTEYEYTWGKRIGNISNRKLIDLIYDIPTTTDLLFKGTITLEKYYTNHDAILTPLWSKSYRNLKHMQSSIVADFTTERPELFI